MIILSIIRDDVLDTIEVFNCFWDAKDFTHEYLKAAGLPKTNFNERFATKMNGRVFVDIPGLFISAVERQALDGDIPFSELAYHAYSKVVTFDVLRTLTVTPPQVTSPIANTGNMSYANSAYDLPMGWDLNGKSVRYTEWGKDTVNIKLPSSLTESEKKALTIARIKLNPSYNLVCVDLRRTFNQKQALNHLDLNAVEGKEIVKLEIEELDKFIQSVWTEDSNYDYDEAAQEYSSWMY